ncbi:Exostosin domain-containing protein [Heracleum sosnowskyi]|uniref:Exostosin domain-containing protein n=1 Tax=Heracleum sosnowskyi TaxID=360622 RepID=A0AAD8MD26_9APIA|nr:Exostosin domain-containing protein [Heracleum sosnowskyi]
MDNRYQFLCKNLILFFAILFAVIVVVQHFELPYGRELLPSLLSPKVMYNKKSNYPVRGESSNFVSVRNQSLKGDLGLVSSNQTSDQNNAGKNWELKDDANSVSNVMQEKPIDTEHNVSSNGFTERGNLSESSNQNRSSDSGLAVPQAIPASDSNLSTPVMYSDSSSRDVKPVPLEGTFRGSAMKVMPLSKMNEFLHQSYSSPHSLPFYSKVERILADARSHIENSPIIHNDTDLHAPLYRNVSMFKRSYEIMEGMLKVYIYKDGEKPIFHDSILNGIYSCEGWFLKLLEANKQFVTQDPGEAHLFYLPFSSRLLQLTLYKKRSHNRKNLSQYMENYVEMLIAKYPYWNRTDGADHFLAACHDWAPKETRGKMLNCIRALCNADVEKGFDIGKDVSLPTTYVQSPQDPIKDIGGNPPLERPILAFFAGYMHGKVRPVLLQHWGNDSDMRIFNRMPHVKGNKNYIEYMRSSKYCICPRGYEVHSPRVVESILYECVPVIISDNYVPPLFEVLNWESFAVFIFERDVPNMKNILLSISEEKYLEMQNRVKRVQKHFLWHAEPLKYDLFHMILHSIWYNRVFRVSVA